MFSVLTAVGHKVSGKSKSAEADKLVGTRVQLQIDGAAHSWPASRRPTLLGEVGYIGRSH